MASRIPFDKCVGDSRLFKDVWLNAFSPEQRAVMKMFYGLPLDTYDMAIWHALHGGGVFTDLYELKEVHDSGVPYIEGLEYADIDLIIGRRGAKTCIGHFVLDVEACCGGHKEYLKNKDQVPSFLHVSQDLGQAMKGQREYSLSYLKGSPIGRELLGDLQRAVVQRSIKLTDVDPRTGERRGLATIKVGSNNIKTGRGDSTAIAVLDEHAFWQSDEKAASPDTEVEKAVAYGMSQFPHAKRIKLTTPYIEEGLAWIDAGIGTRGRFLADPAEREGHYRKLVLQGPSPILKNPSITKVFLTEKRAADPVGFHREIGAKFAKAVSGYLSPDLVRRAKCPGVKRRPPQPGIFYLAAIDPALKGDTFPLCIGHLEGANEFVQDVLVAWQGTKDQPLDPGVIMASVAAEVKPYGITNVLTDQHQDGALGVIARQHGINLDLLTMTVNSKNAVWADFLTLFNQDKVRLLDDSDLEAELCGLERIITKNKTQQIRGKRDDRAIVTAMCLHRALQYGIAAPKKADAVIEPTTSEGIAAVHKLRLAAARKPKVVPKAWWLR